MKNQRKWKVTFWRGDRIDERIIPARTKRQAAERCNRVISVTPYDGQAMGPEKACLFTIKRNA